MTDRADDEPRYSARTEYRRKGGQKVGMDPYHLVVEDTETGHSVRLWMSGHRTSLHKARQVATAVLGMLAEDVR